MRLHFAINVYTIQNSRTLRFDFWHIYKLLKAYSKYCSLSLQEFFENPAFRADGLKIYPTLVIRGTGLYELWKSGRYKSYPPSTLVDLIAHILSLVPPWTRVYRYASSYARETGLQASQGCTAVYIMSDLSKWDCGTLL